MYTSKQIAKIEKFLNGLNIENLEIMDFVTIEEIDKDNAFDSIQEQIDDSNGFEVDIIYYSNAIKYLSENDNSLKESLGIAIELGFKMHTLNSEVLASLLASQNVREEFYDKKDEIENFFNNL